MAILHMHNEKIYNIIIIYDWIAAIVLQEIGVEEHDGDVKIVECLHSYWLLIVTFKCGLGYGADTTFDRTYLS